MNYSNSIQWNHVRLGLLHRLLGIRLRVVSKRSYRCHYSFANTEVDNQHNTIPNKLVDAIRNQSIGYMCVSLGTIELEVPTS